MIERDWKEEWIDEMGLIVALSGKERFTKLSIFRIKMRALLSPVDQDALKEALRQRFTPTNGMDGCQEATAAVKEVVG